MTSRDVQYCWQYSSVPDRYGNIGVFGVFAVVITTTTSSVMSITTIFISTRIIIGTPATTTTTTTTATTMWCMSEQLTVRVRPS